MTKTAELTPPARNAAAPHPVSSRSRDNCHVWQPPKHRSDWLNSLTDAVSSAPPGAMVVYRHAPPSSSAKPPEINKVAASVAARLRCALVQWPEEPCHGDQNKVRTWCYGIQKRGAA